MAVAVVTTKIVSRYWQKSSGEAGLGWGLESHLKNQGLEEGIETTELTGKPIKFPWEIQKDLFKLYCTYTVIDYLSKKTRVY